MLKKMWLGSGLLLFVVATCYGQTANINMQYQLSRDNTGDHLILNGTTNFPTPTITLVGSASTKAGNLVTLTLAPPTVTPVVVNGPGGPSVTGATFSSILSYGAGLTLTSDMVTLGLEASAQPPSGSPVVNRHLVDMRFVNSYFDNLNEVRRLTSIANSIALLPAPGIGVSSITVLDKSIFVRATSNVAVKVKASANVRNTPPSGADPTSDELEIPSGGAVTLKIDRLQENTPYDVLVRETSPHPGRPAVEFGVVTDSSGSPLKTRAVIPVPSVSFTTNQPLKIVRNQRIEIPLNIMDAPRVKVTLQAQNSLGVFTDAEPATIFALDSPPGVAKQVSVTLALKQTTLDQQIPYRVKIEGLTQFDEAAGGPSIISSTFNGLAPLLTKAVDLEFTAGGINFRASTNSVPAKLEVKVGDPPKTFSFSTPGQPDPTFLLSFADIQNASPTTGPSATPTDVRLPLTIGVRADDGSEREQTISVAMKINRSEITSRPSNAKNKITSFVRDLRSGQDLNPGNGSSIKVGDILKTGLSMLLRFLAPIP